MGCLPGERVLHFQIKSLIMDRKIFIKYVNIKLHINKAAISIIQSSGHQCQMQKTVTGMKALRKMYTCQFLMSVNEDQPYSCFILLYNHNQAL